MAKKKAAARNQIKDTPTVPAKTLKRLLRNIEKVMSSLAEHQSELRRWVSVLQGEIPSKKKHRSKKGVPLDVMRSNARKKSSGGDR